MQCPDSHIAVLGRVGEYIEDTVTGTQRGCDNDCNLIETKPSTQTRSVMISATLVSDEEE